MFGTGNCDILFPTENKCIDIQWQWSALKRLNRFGSCPGLQINDINKVSISLATGGDMGVHVESHMTKAEIRENEIRLRGDRGAGSATTN